MRKYILLMLTGLFVSGAGTFSSVNAEQNLKSQDNDLALSEALVGEIADKRVSFWRRKLNAGFFMLRQTPTGNKYYDYGLENHLKPVWFNTLLQEPYKLIEKDVLKMTSQIVIAWPDYIAWTLIQGFVRFEHNVILEKYGSPKIGNFAELDQWALLIGLRQWRERGISLEYDFDSPIINKWEAKVTPFYNARKVNLESFLKLTAERHKRLYSDSVTMDEYLKNTKLSDNERKAVLELKRQWNLVLSEEKDLEISDKARALKVETVFPGVAEESSAFNQVDLFKNAFMP